MFKVNFETINSKIEQLGYTQQEIADKAHTSKSTLSRMLSGKITKVDLEILYHLSNLLNLRIDELIINDTQVTMSDPKNYLEQIEHMMGYLYRSIKHYNNSSYPTEYKFELKENEPVYSTTDDIEKSSNFNKNFYNETVLWDKINKLIYEVKMTPTEIRDAMNKAKNK